jgi:hypothetical protein
MPAANLFRLISSANSVDFSGPTFVADDRASAIASARSRTGTQATAVGRLSSGYPQLLPYKNDNSPNTFTKNPPAYIWDSVTTTPQTRFFASSPTNFVAFFTGDRVLVNLTVFCDNAHDVQIDIFDEDNNDLFTTITPIGNLTDGSLDPFTGTNDDTPFNWLNIRYYANLSDAVPLARNGHAFNFVVSFQAVNYTINPPEAPNPAALAFVADFYQIS